MIPVQCAGLQIEVPRKEHRPWRFLLRVLLAVAIWAGGCGLTVSGDWQLMVVGVLIEGLFFAHLLELAHSCIHGTAFGTRRVDRIAGTLLSLPMLVSYSDYRENHLEHHRTLGISEKKDFFGYEFDDMPSWWTFALQLWMIDHYRNALKKIVRTVARGTSRDIKVNSRVEHLLMLGWLLVPLVALAFGHPGPFLVLVLPLFVAAPCHVLVELPEHWHCRIVGDPLGHSRSISASRLAVWFTNGNNYHFEHHLCPWLSNDALREVHRKLQQVIHPHPSYFEFYSQVVGSLGSTQRSV